MFHSRLTHAAQACSPTRTSKIENTRPRSLGRANACLESTYRFRQCDTEWSLCVHAEFSGLREVRERPATDIEIGFNSTLPCLLGILAIRQRRSITWDRKMAKPV
jgi:hypothetical protein